MTHFYERNIVEIKTEYTMFLTNIITPLIYEGIKKMYLKSVETEKIFQEAIRDNADIENPGVLKIFQTFLKGIKNINNHNIEAESNRIKEKSKCSEWFDELVRAVVKSYIVLLTYNASGKTCRLVNEKFHESIDTKTFIHKCYVECARLFFNYPELFWHGFTTIEVKRNQREAFDIIRVAINEAIRKMLPMKLILQEYLKNDYIHEEESEISQSMPESHYKNIKSLVKKDLGANLILESDDDDLESEIKNIDKNEKEIKDEVVKDEVVNIDILLQNGIPVQPLEPVKDKSAPNVSDNEKKLPEKKSSIEKTSLGDKQSLDKPPSVAVDNPPSSTIVVDRKKQSLDGEINNLRNGDVKTNKSVFSHKHVDNSVNIADNTEMELKRRLKDPGYLKSPVPIRGGKNLILKDAIDIYKKNYENPKDASDSFDIDVVQKSVKSDRSAYYDKLLKTV